MLPRASSATRVRAAPPRGQRLDERLGGGPGRRPGRAGGSCRRARLSRRCKAGVRCRSCPWRSGRWPSCRRLPMVMNAARPLDARCISRRRAPGVTPSWRRKGAASAPGRRSRSAAAMYGQAGSGREQRSWRWRPRRRQAACHRRRSRRVSPRARGRGCDRMQVDRGQTASSRRGRARVLGVGLEQRRRRARSPPGSGRGRVERADRLPPSSSTAAAVIARRRRRRARASRRRAGRSRPRARREPRVAECRPAPGADGGVLHPRRRPRMQVDAACRRVAEAIGVRAAGGVGDDGAGARGHRTGARRRASEARSLALATMRQVERSRAGGAAPACRPDARRPRLTMGVARAGRCRQRTVDPPASSGRRSPCTSFQGIGARQQARRSSRRRGCRPRRRSRRAYPASRELGAASVGRRRRAADRDASEAAVRPGRADALRARRGGRDDRHALGAVGEAMGRRVLDVDAEMHAALLVEDSGGDREVRNSGATALACDACGRCSTRSASSAGVTGTSTASLKTPGPTARPPARRIRHSSFGAPSPRTRAELPAATRPAAGRAEEEPHQFLVRALRRGGGKALNRHAGALPWLARASDSADPLGSSPTARGAGVSASACPGVCNRAGTAVLSPSTLSTPTTSRASAMSSARARCGRSAATAPAAAADRAVACCGPGSVPAVQLDRGGGSRRRAVRCSARPVLP